MKAPAKKFPTKIRETAKPVAHASFQETPQEPDFETLEQDWEQITPKEPIPDLYSKQEVIPKAEVDEYINQKFAEFKATFANNTQTVKAPEPSPKKVETSDDLPEFENWVEKDRIYVLCTGYSSLSHGIKDRHKKNSPLMYKGRSLRYSTSQASFFMDKQVGDVLLSYLSIDEGKLHVSKENTHLQKFLAIHPDNGVVFKEFDPELESKATYEIQKIKKEAHYLSDNITDLTRDSVAMLMCKNYLESWDQFTIKSNLYNEIEANPKQFIKLAGDPILKQKSVGKIAVIRGYLKYANFKFYDEKEQVICDVKMHENEYESLASYFSSSQGRNLYEYLVHKIEK